MQDLVLNGEQYRDDRMFVLYLSKCTRTEVGGGMFETTIYHDEAPANHIWCLVTYRNTRQYPIHRVNHFGSLREARAYMERVEPQTPLVSLGGRSPASPLPYEQFVEWKSRNRMQEFNPSEVYSPGLSNAREIVITGRP